MSGVFGSTPKAPPPPAAPPAPRGERVEEATMRRGREDEMARRAGAGAQVLAGETTGDTKTGTKKLLGS